MLRQSLILLMTALLALPASAGSCDDFMLQIPIEVTLDLPGFPWTHKDTLQLVDSRLGDRVQNADKVIAGFRGETYEILTRTRFDALLLEHAALFRPVRVIAELVFYGGARIAIRLEKEEFEEITELTKTPLIEDNLDLEAIAAQAIDAVDFSETGRLEIVLRENKSLRRIRLATEGDSLIFLFSQHMKSRGRDIKLTNFRYDKIEQAYKAELGNRFVHFDAPQISTPRLKVKGSEIQGLIVRRDPNTLYSEFHFFLEDEKGFPYDLISRSYLDGVRALEALIANDEITVNVEQRKDAIGGSVQKFTFPADSKLP